MNLDHQRLCGLVARLADRRKAWNAAIFSTAAFALAVTITVLSGSPLTLASSVSTLVPALVPSVHSTDAIPLALVFHELALKLPLFAVTEKFTVAPAIASPLELVTLIPTALGSLSPATPICPSPVAAASAAGASGSVVDPPSPPQAASAIASTSPHAAPDARSAADDMHSLHN